MLTLVSMLQRSELLYGGGIAVRDPGGNLTWRDYIDRSARAAGMLRGLGLRAGDRFAILARNSARYAELLHAAYWSGAVPVPVNFRLAPAEISALMEDADCAVLAVEESFAGLLLQPPLDASRPPRSPR